MVNASYQAVVLAGGEDQILYPLTTTTVKALLPVANKPLISYPLRTLAEAGLRSAIVVVINERAAACVREWIAAEYAGSPGALQCEVVSVPEGYGTADALRSVASRITSPSFVVLSGDLLTDVPVGALVAQHNLHAAMATMLLAQRKVSPASETKPGKPPKNVDYIGLDPSRQHLLFYASSPDALRDLKVPLPTVRRYGTMSISSNFIDAHLYIFNRSVLHILADNPKLSSLRQDMLPYLTQHQFRIRNQQLQQQRALTAAQQSPASSLLLPGPPEPVGPVGAVGGRATGGSTTSLMTAPSSEVEADGASDMRFNLVPELPGSHFMTMAHGPSAPAAPESLLRVQVVGPEDAYCARVLDVQAYGEVNREVADPGVALKLSGLKPGRFDNIVPPSASLGNKSTVAAGCILGEGCVVGDKSSIKRSVMGGGCRLGANVKVINSVLMDGVVVADGAHVQNSVLCKGAAVQAGATLKDCQVGAGCTVAGGVEYKGEVLVIKGAATR
ncbi:hypothetical protein PLESTB_001434500 [Pleodorina starrii]|uniref:Translation initiation factor eIF2B subunit gamma n=1 Tax=Pleodorina starrii TaxID=330485 RepID=A0A9W6BVV2_9CHLO|nr:hypothetical protein PLESTM_001393500 [Pleodorina starrii]GLC59028.1 hypothetical protein PLESTB_001434500 [Pleodorina starrii]GLC67621.1 hypothetical protein PLESTF_000583800 [Pleodorina starrii]